LVTYVDRKVGEVLDTLRALGLDRDTLVVFTSDHGDMLGEKGLIGKKLFYEWSARVPLIFHFPDGRGAGRVVTTPVSLVDLLPTVLEVCSVEAHLPLDGQSLLAMVKQKVTEPRPVFSEMHSEGIYAPCFMVRRENFKYIYIHGGEPMLFDLDTDPSENVNLSGHPEYQLVEDELRALILDRFDPEIIEADLGASLKRRQLIRSAMDINQTSWEYSPFFDATKQYVRRHGSKVN
jgi:choline-sulfatase